MREVSLEVEFCRKRQQRLLDAMQHLGLDLVILTCREHVQWLCGPCYASLFSPLAALRSDGHCTFVVPNAAGENVAADRIVPYEAQWKATLRNDQPAAAAAVLLGALLGGPAARRVGVEFSCCGPHLTGRLQAELIDIEVPMYQLRRRKEADELACITRAIAATGAMYEKAREVIEPGIRELSVFNYLQASVVETLGERPTAMGNDFACGCPGGPPTNRRAEEGELYILDLGPAYRGYYADNCRTIAVNRHPTDAQQAAWEQIAGIFPIIHQRVRPGFSCKALYHEVKTLLDEFLPGGFSHHLGHGIGLFPHEAPHLNDAWDDTFVEGDVFTVEPGLYAPQLRGGIRLENNYRVTADGVELLSPFPLEMA
jgi:Xaa-Pro aminopeptidase